MCSVIFHQEYASLDGKLFPVHYVCFPRGQLHLRSVVFRLKDPKHVCCCLKDVRSCLQDDLHVHEPQTIALRGHASQEVVEWHLMLTHRECPLRGQNPAQVAAPLTPLPLTAEAHM